MRPWSGLGLALSCTLTAACGFSAPQVGDAPGAPGGDGDCTTFSAQLDTCELPVGFPLRLSGVLVLDTDTGVLKNAANIEIPIASLPIPTLGAEMRVIVATSAVFQAGTILRA